MAKSATKPKPAPPTKAERLVAAARAAADVRAYDTHPDVVALQVERTRRQVDALMWTGIVLGLGFTMTNVQVFAAAGAAVGTLSWLAAWLLDPMVSLVLIAVLRAEQVTARYQVETGKWVRTTKLLAFAATYVMNTWQSFKAGSPAGIVLHSVPPLLVFCAAEAAPMLRDRLTESIHKAAAEAARLVAETRPADGPAIAAEAARPVVESSADRARPTAEPGPADVTEAARPTAEKSAEPRPAARPRAARPTARKAAETRPADGPADPADVAALLPAALKTAADLGEPLTRDRLIGGLRAAGVSVGHHHRGPLYKAVKAALAEAEARPAEAARPPLHVVDDPGPADPAALAV